MSRHQSNCDCNAKLGAVHADGCSALAPPPESEESKFQRELAEHDRRSSSSSGS